MLPLHPVGWHRYLHTALATPPKSIMHHSYASWEDAVWDLVRFFEYTPPISALIPEFFCPDVIENMQQHGIQCISYPVDAQFQTALTTFRHCLNQHRPQIVVILHAVGITNSLFSQTSEWLSALPSNTLLIEDSVHRVVNPHALSLLTDRHVIIDSLRKVVPLPGANVYGTPAITQLTHTVSKQTLLYRYEVLGWWVLFQLCLLCVRLLPLHRWRTAWSLLAEHTMLHGYDRIGDSKIAGSGYAFSRFLTAHIAHQHIAARKQHQVQQYLQLLEPIWHSPAVFKITVPKNDWGQLRAFPVGLQLQFAAAILDLLRAKGLLVRFELDGCAWSMRQKVIYLPLGPHLRLNEITEVAQVVCETVLQCKLNP